MFVFHHPHFPITFSKFSLFLTQSGHSLWFSCSLSWRHPQSSCTSNYSLVSGSGLEVQNCPYPDIFMLPHNYTYQISDFVYLFLYIFVHYTNCLIIFLVCFPINYNYRPYSLFILNYCKLHRRMFQVCLKICNSGRLLIIQSSCCVYYGCISWAYIWLLGGVRLLRERKNHCFSISLISP